MYLKKKILFDDDKKNLINLVEFLCQTEILLLKTLMLLKIPGFQGFFKISQIPGFSRLF